MFNLAGEIEEVLRRYHSCDNSSCGNGAICNYCSLKKDIESILDKARRGR